MTFATTDNIEIAILRKNAHEDVVIAWRTFPDGNRLLDLRTYKLGRLGKMEPTGRGITIKPGQLDALSEAILKAISQQETETTA